MVFCGLPGPTQPPLRKLFQGQPLLPVSPPEAVVVDNIEVDFSDVFGPPPALHSTEETFDELGHLILNPDASEIAYDDSAVTYRRSHSLVGPTSGVAQRLKLSNLFLHEIEDGLEQVKCVSIKEDEDCCYEKPAEDTDVDPTCVSGSIGIEDFEFLKVVGQGAFGKVYQVRKKGTLEIFAMKVVRKDKIVEKNHAEYMKAERDILTRVDHPFIVKLRYSFQTKYRLYLVLDFINGGHLFFQLYNHGLFREDLARFYAAEIVAAVSHLHANGIMHRDLKPENILLDADGHVILTDFGLAKQFDENTRSNSLCGTVEYMSPEIVLGKGHNKAADWWSVGILIYEMLTGKPPFICGNRQKIQQKIVRDKMKLPAFLSAEAHALLKGLLQKDASKRLGSGATGSEEIKGHKWFRPINWKKLQDREIQPSFRPQVAGKLCIANFDKRWTEMPVLDSPASSPKTNMSVFANFTFIRPAASSPDRNRTLLLG